MPKKHHTESYFRFKQQHKSVKHFIGKLSGRLEQSDVSISFPDHSYLLSISFGFSTAIGPRFRTWLFIFNIALMVVAFTTGVGSVWEGFYTRNKSYQHRSRKFPKEKCSFSVHTPHGSGVYNMGVHTL